jgi:hypothetical protein
MLLLDYVCPVDISALFLKFHDSFGIQFPVLRAVLLSHSFMRHAGFRDLYDKIFTFLGFFFLLFEIFAKLLMFFCDLIDQIFVIDDFSRIL